MSDFHALLRAVHGEMWEAGPDQGIQLQSLLDCLSDAPPPDGICRLATSRMAPGPHLAAQMEGAPPDTGVVWLDARRPREQAVQRRLYP